MPRTPDLRDDLAREDMLEDALGPLVGDKRRLAGGPGVRVGVRDDLGGGIRLGTAIHIRDAWAGRRR